MKPIYIAGLDTTPGPIKISAQEEANDLERKGIIESSSNYFATRLGTKTLRAFETEENYYSSLVDNVRMALEEAKIESNQITHLGYIGDLFEKTQLPRPQSKVAEELGLRYVDIGIQTGCAAFPSQAYNMLIHAQAQENLDEFYGLILGGGVVRDYLQGTDRGIFSDASGALVVSGKKGLASIIGGEMVTFGDTDTFEKKEGHDLNMNGRQVSRFVLGDGKRISIEQVAKLIKKTGSFPSEFFNHNSNERLQKKLPYKKFNNKTFSLYGNTRGLTPMIEMDHEDGLRNLPHDTSFAVIGYGEGLKVSTIFGKKT